MSPRSSIVVIPAHNEEAQIAGVIAALRAAHPELEITVVDDGSRDATAAVAGRAGATVLSHPFNLGYGAALQTGYKYALARGAGAVVQMDADGQHDPGDIAALLEPIRSGELDLVIGSRFLEKTGYRMGFARDVGRRLFQAVARAFGVTVRDPTSGFQAMNRRVLEEYARDFFPSDFPDVDVLVVAHQRGLRMAERSVRMREGVRASTLHGGLRDVYYVYKMLLSIWSEVGRMRPTVAEAARSES
jgi:hypothetical protein